MSPDSLRPALAALATLLTVVAYAPYLRAIQRGQVRPHLFTWIVWGISTAVAFFAALATGGGAGAWVIGFSAIVSLFIAALAWRRRADLAIARADWLFFVAALAAIPLWALTRDPLWAVWLITAVELLGFAPTFRKTWHQPRSESMTFMGLIVLRNALLLAALERHALTTVLFPAAAAAACLALIALMLWRRRAADPTPERAS